MILIMKTNRYLGVGVLLLLFSGISGSENSCSPPNYPGGGNYYPRQAKYQPRERITYSCAKTYALIGNDTNKCKLNGEWSNPTPFCDLKATLTRAERVVTLGYGWLSSVQRNDVIDVMDGNLRTCVLSKTGDSHVVYMDKKKAVFAIRIFFRRGPVNIDIYVGMKICIKDYVKNVETSQWVLIQCKESDEFTNVVQIDYRSSKDYHTTVCDIEVYVKEKDGCDNPPDRKVANGYFQVSRNRAHLFCEDGFRRKKDRLVCEGNEWKGKRLLCEEILCSSELNLARKAGNEWAFLDSVRKISIGTRRQLKCSTGYQKTGEPDIIVCQENGNWTETNATCIEERNFSTRFITYIAVGTVVLLIIIVVLGTTIYLVRKQRKRPVVVIYKSPTEGSVVSGSEGDYATIYYETTRDYQNIAPVLQASSPSTAQMLSEGYILPLDNKDTFRREPTPADIVFGTLKKSTIYGY